METYDLLVELYRGKDVWKSARMNPGELSVMISGQQKMPLLFADGLDSLQSVSYLITTNYICISQGYICYADSTALSRAAFGLGTGPIHFDDLRCTGSEATLFECPFNAIHNCGHFEDAGVRCLPDGPCNKSVS